MDSEDLVYQKPKVAQFLSKACCWADGRVRARRQGLLSALSGSHAVRQWELDAGTGKLHRVGSSQVLGCDSGSANDLDRSRAGAVSAGHFIVEL